MSAIDVRETQAPLIARYRQDPTTAVVTDTAITSSARADDPFHFNVEPMRGSGSKLPIGVHEALGGPHEAAVVEPLAERAVTSGREPDGLLDGHDRHADVDATVDLECDEGQPAVVALDEHARAVDAVEDPAASAGARRRSRLLAEEAVGRARCGEHVAHGRLGGHVGVGDDGAVVLAALLDRREPSEVLHGGLGAGECGVEGQLQVGGHEPGAYAALSRAAV